MHRIATLAHALASFSLLSFRRAQHGIIFLTAPWEFGLSRSRPAQQYSASSRPNTFLAECFFSQPRDLIIPPRWFILYRKIIAAGMVAQVNKFSVKPGHTS